jgi:hypothetical protein
MGGAALLVLLALYNPFSTLYNADRALVPSLLGGEKIKKKTMTIKELEQRIEMFLQECDKNEAVYEKQEGNCFLCGAHLYGWQVQQLDGIDRAVCWRSCDDKIIP